MTTAHERGAKVRAHVADKEMILECIELGVDVLDHGDEIDDECVERKGRARHLLGAEPRLRVEPAGDRLRRAVRGVAALKLYDHVRATLPVAQAAGVRILLGDDYSGVFRSLIEDDPLDHEVGNYGRELAFYGAIDGIEPVDVLSWGTSIAGQLLVDPPAKVGVVEPGALADLIVVDGDPVADLSLLARPQTTSQGGHP